MVSKSAIKPRFCLFLEYKTHVLRVPKLDGSKNPLPGPSATTSAELEALDTFRKADLPFVPHLVASTLQLQGSRGLLPGGYIAITVMTKMPGQTILDLRFWSLAANEQGEIRKLFWEQIQYGTNSFIRSVSEKRKTLIDAQNDLDTRHRTIRLRFEKYLMGSRIETMVRKFWSRISVSLES